MMMIDSRFFLAVLWCPKSPNDNNYNNKETDNNNNNNSNINDN